MFKKFINWLRKEIRGWKWASEDRCDRCGGELYWFSSSRATCDDCGNRIPRLF